MRTEIKQRVEMIRRGEVPEGYKQTKVGIIPKDWEIKNLDMLSIGKGTYGANAAAIPYSKDLPRYLRITDFDDNGNILKNTKMSVDIGENKKYILENGDLLFARTGNSTGKTYLYNDKDGYLVYAGFLIKFKLDKKKVNYRYIKYQTNSDYYSKWVKIMSLRSGQPGINSQEYGKFHLPLPQLPEQQSIAQILSTADKAIETTETLITLKQKKKKWLMQNLLTGKVRLPEYDNCPVPVQERIRMINEGMVPEGYKQTKVGIIPVEWGTKKLNEISELIVSNVDKKTKKEEDTVLLCNYMDVYSKNYIDLSLDFMKSTAKASEIEKFQLQEGDVLITKDSETREDIAVSSFVKETQPKLLCGYHLAIIRPKNISGIYLNYLFKNRLIKNQFVVLANGVTRFGLTKDSIKKAYVLFPPLQEQTAIANILTTADKEIDLLNQKLDTLKQQKKALMQLLLTGIGRTTGLNLSSDTEKEGVAYVQ